MCASVIVELILCQVKPHYVLDLVPKFLANRCSSLSQTVLGQVYATNFLMVE